MVDDWKTESENLLKMNQEPMNNLGEMLLSKGFCPACHKLNCGTHFESKIAEPQKENITMNDLKAFVVGLLSSRIIDITSFVSQRDGKWTITRSFAGLPNNTVAANQAELYDKIAVALVTQYQNGSMRAAS